MRSINEKSFIRGIFSFLFLARGFEREGTPAGMQGSGNGSFPFGVTRRDKRAEALLNAAKRAVSVPVVGASSEKSNILAILCDETDLNITEPRLSGYDYCINDRIFLIGALNDLIKKIRSFTLLYCPYALL